MWRPGGLGAVLCQSAQHSVGAWWHVSALSVVTQIRQWAVSRDDGLHSFLFKNKYMKIYYCMILSFKLFLHVVSFFH